MAQQGRVQVRELQSDIRLRPAPMQSDTYAPPPRPVADQNLGRLADALGSFSNSLGNLVGVVGKPDKAAREREDAIFQKRIAGQTLEETRQDISDGRMMVTDDKFANAARQTVYGNKWAQSEASKMDTILQTEFDWDSGNPEQFLAQHFQKTLEEIGLSDPNAIASASKAWDQYKTSVLAKQEKYRIDRTNQSTVDTAFTVVHDKSKEWIENGLNPEQFAGNLNKMRAELGTKGSLGANEEVLDQEYLNAAARLVEENPEHAIAMLDAEYDGRSGKTSLSTQRDYRDRVLQIKARASEVMGKRRDATFEADVSSQADGLLELDNLDRLTDISYTDRNGEEKTIKAEEVKEGAFNRYLTRSNEIAQVNKEAPQQTVERELRKAQLAGLEHPQLKALVTGIAGAASVDLTQDPDGLNTVMEKVKTARWLQGVSKNTYIAYTEEADRDFMESFMIAKDEMTGDDGRQLSDAGALEFAVRTSQPLSNDGLNFTREQNDVIDRSVKSLASSGGYLFGLFGTSTTPWNAAAGQQRVASLAKRLVRGGMAQDKAIEVAADSVKRNSITYNGSLLSVGKTALPDNFKDALDGLIGDFAKSSPGVLKDLDIDTGDITIIPIGDINRSAGRFMLIDKNTGSYIMDDKSGQPTFVTLQSIRDRSRKIADDKFQKEADKVSIRGAAASNGLQRATDPDGNTIFINPKTREIMEIGVPEPGSKPVLKKTGRRLSNGQAARRAVQQGSAEQGGLYEWDEDAAREKYRKEQAARPKPPGVRDKRYALPKLRQND